MGVFWIRLGRLLCLSLSPLCAVVGFGSRLSVLELCVGFLALAESPTIFLLVSFVYFCVCVCIAQCLGFLCVPFVF